jgi:hypothetical protein
VTSMGAVDLLLASSPCLLASGLDLITIGAWLARRPPNYVEASNHRSLNAHF